MSDPIVIVSAARTPIGGMLGDFSGLAAYELGAVAIKAAAEGPITAQVPASVIQLHRTAYVIVDKDAASGLSGRYPGTWRSSFTLEP